MSLNTAQIRDRAREITGRTISDQEAQQVMNVTGGGDEAQVYAYFRGGSGSPGSSSGGGADTAASLIQAAIDKYTGLFDEYSRKYREFDAANPFVFDDILSEESRIASQRLDPYYQQTLGDFLSGVEKKRQRGYEDTRNLLAELNQDINDYTGDAKLGLQRSVERTREGYADVGLSQSGAALGSEGIQAAQTGDQLNRYLSRQEERRTGINRAQDRFITDLGLEESLQRRNLAREQAYNVQSQALGETERRQRQREYEKAQYTGLPPGASPQQYSSYTLGLLG